MLLKKFLHKLHLPCSEATFLMEKKIANNISRKEKYRLFMHLKICKYCKSYNNKIFFIDKLFKSNIEESKINTTELDNLKKKITEKLKL